MAELMAPARDCSGVVLALEAGADSIYAGVPGLSLRPRRYEPSMDDLATMVDSAHEVGKKAYGVANLFMKEVDWVWVGERLVQAIDLGLDALIVADPAVIERVRADRPQTPIHISVQNSVASKEAAMFYADMGADLVVISRSLENMETIRDIVSGCGLQTEVFVHGGICYMFDGKCLMSSYYHQRPFFDADAGMWRFLGQNNSRGECHLVCKRECAFEGDSGIGRPLRRPDLVGLELIPDYLRMGVDVFKLEGRAMPIEYIVEATRLYREVIDFYSDRNGGAERPEDWPSRLDMLLKARLYYERNWRISEAESSS